MPDMLQVHNTEAEGGPPQEHDEESGEGFSIWTRKNFRPETVAGNRVWVIRAEGSPRRYWLCYTFVVDGMDKDASPYCVFGHEGLSFDPEISLDHESGWFQKLYEWLNRFSLGFSMIDDESAIEFDKLRQARCHG